MKTKAKLVLAVLLVAGGVAAADDDTQAMLHEILARLEKMDARISKLEDASKAAEAVHVAVADGKTRVVALGGILGEAGDARVLELKKVRARYPDVDALVAAAGQGDAEARAQLEALRTRIDGALGAREADAKMVAQVERLKETLRDLEREFAQRGREQGAMAELKRAQDREQMAKQAAEIEKLRTQLARARTANEELARALEEAKENAGAR